MPSATLKVSHVTKEETLYGVGYMILGLVFTGVLGGIAALVLFQAIEGARGSASKLHDRYHE